GITPLHTGQVHRCSALLSSICNSVQRLIVPVRCWFTIALVRPDQRSFLAIPFLISSSYILGNDDDLLVSPKSLALPISLILFSISARSIGSPSETVARPASLSALSLPHTPT